MSNLFEAPQQNQTAHTSVVKFKCGRTKHEKLPDGSYKVTPIAARGYLDLQNVRTGMYELVWSTRDGTVPRDSHNNIILFKSEQRLDNVATGNDDDQVFVITLQNNRRHFFWVQEPDREEWKKIEAQLREALGCDDSDALNAALAAIGLSPADVNQPSGGQND